MVAVSVDTLDESGKENPERGDFKDAAIFTFLLLPYKMLILGYRHLGHFSERI